MENLRLGKFFNSLLKSDTDSDDYVDLDNYIFRLNYYLENTDIKIANDESLSKNDTEVLEKFIKSFFQDVRKNPKIDNYLSKKKREYKELKAMAMKNENLDLIIIKDGETCEEKKEKIDPSVTTVSSETSLDQKLNEEMVQKCFNYVQAFLKLFVMENENEKQLEDKMKEIFISVLTEKSIEFIKNFCILLVQNLAGTQSEKYETKIFLLANILLSLSSNTTLVTYSKLTVILKNLFGNYLIIINCNNNSKQIEKFTLSKRMLAMCSCLFKSFSSQFTEACFIEWVKILVIESKVKNNTNIEFLLKLFKDLFNESEALFLLNYFIRQHFEDTWSEEYYIFLNNIFDKILKLNFSDLVLIINKMKADSMTFCKSLAFAKLLSTVINKLKALITVEDNAEYFEAIKGDILIIIEQNKTLMKKKLETMLD